MSGLHQRVATIVDERISRTPRTSTACSRASTRTPGPTTRHLVIRERRGQEGTASTRKDRAHRPASSPAAGASKAVPGAARTAEAATSALRLPDHQAALRPLHAGDGGAGVRRARRTCSSLSPGLDGAIRAGNAPGAVYTRWAGPITRSARRYIRAAAIIQLLLGNIGRPGGGILRAARARQHPGLDRHPDPLQHAARLSADARHETRKPDRVYEQCRAAEQKGFWRNADAYMISLLKEYWGDAATPENDICFDYLPRINGDHGTYRTVMDMVDGKVSGTSCSARIRPWARRTAGCSAWAWPTWTGWWYGT